jgi:hypothetical protein
MSIAARRPPYMYACSCSLQQRVLVARSPIAACGGGSRESGVRTTVNRNQLPTCPHNFDRRARQQPQRQPQLLGCWWATLRDGVDGASVVRVAARGPSQRVAVRIGFAAATKAKTRSYAKLLLGCRVH